MERRLAAILAADVAGFTRLMAADEAGTFRRLKDLRESILEPLIAGHRGRVVKLMGDGVLAEFSSVVDAVACAVDWQVAVTDHESVQPEATRLAFRIGINLGDLIVDGDDIYGDGVNIAARLEGLADPGGICLSGDSYRQVRGKIDRECEDMGEQVLKNVAESVRVYRILAGAAQHAGPAPMPKADKPSVAVLPFDNMSGNSSQDYFSDGITEDIITELSRFVDLMVIARNSTFVYKGSPVKPQDVARDLGVRYVVEGSVRRAGDRVRVTAQLVDAGSGGHVWAERYDRDLNDIFEVQDEISRAIAAALGTAVTSVETRRALQRPPANMAAYEHCLRAWEIGLGVSRDAQEEAMAEAEAAIACDPAYSRPYAILALYNCSWAWNGWAADAQAAVATARELARKAVSLNPDDHLALLFSGIAELWFRDFDRAVSLTVRSIEINPNFADGYAWHGSVLIFVGKAKEGLAQVAAARRLNPRGQVWYGLVEARGLFALQRFDEAARAAEDVLATTPNFTAALGLAAASNAALGRMDRTKDSAVRIAETAPHYTLSRARSLMPYKNQDDLDTFLHWAREAGIPE